MSSCTMTMEGPTQARNNGVKTAATSVKSSGSESVGSQALVKRGLAGRRYLFCRAFDMKLLEILAEAIPGFPQAKDALTISATSFQATLWQWQIADFMAWAADLLRRDFAGFSSKAANSKNGTVLLKATAKLFNEAFEKKLYDEVSQFDFSKVYTQAMVALKHTDRVIKESCCGSFDFEALEQLALSRGGPMFEVSYQPSIALDDPQYGFFTPNAGLQNTSASAGLKSVLQARENARAFIRDQRKDSEFRELLRTLVYLGRKHLSMLAEISQLRDPHEFMGPIRLIDIPGRGSGVVVVGNVRAGELLIAQRAMIIKSSHDEVEDEIERLIRESMKTNDKQFNRHLNNFEFQTRTWSERLGRDECHECACGRHFRSIKKTSIKSACEPLSVAKVEELCLRRCFGFTRSPSKSEDHSRKQYQSKFSDECAGLWTAPVGLIQHSCAPNTSREHIGSMVFIRAAVDLRPGDIITTNYVGYSPAPFDYSTRRGVLRDWAILSCQCPLCLFQASLPVCTMDRLEKLQDKAASCARKGIKLLKLAKKLHAESSKTCKTQAGHPSSKSDLSERQISDIDQSRSGQNAADIALIGHEINRIAAKISSLVTLAIRLHGVSIPDIHRSSHSLLDLAERIGEALLQTKQDLNLPRPFRDAAQRWHTSERTVATSISLFLNSVLPYLQLLYTNRSCEQCHLEHRPRKTAICALEFVLSAGLWQDSFGDPRVLYAPDDYLCDIEPALKHAREVGDQPLVKDLEGLTTHLTDWSRSKASGGDYNFAAAAEVSGFSHLNDFGSTAASLAAIAFLDRQHPQVDSGERQSFTGPGSCDPTGERELDKFDRSLSLLPRTPSSLSLAEDALLEASYCKDDLNAFQSTSSTSNEEAICRAAGFFTKEAFADSHLRKIKLWIEITKLADRLRVNESASHYSWKATYADLETVERVCGQDARWAKIFF